MIHADGIGSNKGHTYCQEGPGDPKAISLPYFLRTAQFTHLTPTYFYAYFCAPRKPTEDPEPIFYLFLRITESRNLSPTYC